MDIHALLKESKTEPRFNQVLSDGFAFHDMQGQIKYLESHMRSLMHTVPKNFKFEGITLTDPREEIKDESRCAGNAAGILRLPVTILRPSYLTDGPASV